jgi:hypothetical protein
MQLPGVEREADRYHQRLANITNCCVGIVMHRTRNGDRPVSRDRPAEPISHRPQTVIAVIEMSWLVAGKGSIQEWVRRLGASPPMRSGATERARTRAPL